MENSWAHMVDLESVSAVLRTSPTSLSKPFPPPLGNPRMSLGYEVVKLFQGDNRYLRVSITVKHDHFIIRPMGCSSESGPKTSESVCVKEKIVAAGLC